MNYDNWKTTEPDDPHGVRPTDDEPDEPEIPEDPDDPGVLDSPAWVSDDDDIEDEDGNPL